MPKTEEPEEIYQEFVGQRDDEEVVVILLKHWYTLVQPIAIALGVIILTFAFPMWLGITEWIFRYGITAAIYYLWLVFWVIKIVYEYITWYQDRYIITDERVIDINQKGIFHRQVSEVEITNIQSIIHKISGPAATVLNFGNVIIKSAGGDEIELRQVGYPAEVQEEVTRLMKGGTSKPKSEDIADFLKHTES